MSVFSRSALVCLVAVMLLTFSPMAEAGSRAIVLQERLNQGYGAELVSVVFAAAAGECVADGVALAGPGGPVAVQLADMELWPDGTHVKSARLWFVAEPLAALGSATYTLSWGTTAVKQPMTELVVTPVQTRGLHDRVDIKTNQLQLSWLTGAAREDAKPPAPLLGLGFPTTAGLKQPVASLGEAGASWTSELVARGPVFATVRTTYTLADGTTSTLSATVVAGDNTVRWQTETSADKPELAIPLVIPAATGVTEAILPKGYGQWARDRKTTVATGDEPFAWLAPDSSVTNIFADSPQQIRLPGEGPELVLQSRDAAYWVDPPQPLTYAGFPSWHVEAIPLMWAVWQRKRIPVRYEPDQVTLTLPLAAGGRRWLTSAGDPLIGDGLDAVKDMVLDWPADPAVAHPGVFVDTARIRATRERAATDELLAKMFKAGSSQGAIIALPLVAQDPAERDPKAVAKNVEQLRADLARMGNFDVMRHAISMATHYDTIIDSGMLSAEDHALFRAQMAYMGYLLADPHCWSMEHGYLSGNPNMTVSYTTSLGIIACILRDHPMARTWADRTTAWMDVWLDNEVGENGEWLPEGGHYGYVSIDPIVVYAIAATRAGYHDYRQDERLKRLLLYAAQYHTPRDSQRQDRRTISAYGRGHGGTQPIFGVAAAFYAETDPALSQTLQWLWHESANPVYLPDGRLGGTEPYYMDTTLPAAQPDWGSASFPQLGVVLRHGFGTANESFVNALTATDSKRNLDIWTPEVGGIAQWFGRGQPLSTCFTYDIGYKERHELLRNGVRLARNWGAEGDAPVPFGYYTTTAVEGVGLLPTADYARSTFTHTAPDDRLWLPKVPIPAFPRVTAATEPTLTWTRQLLFVKDPTADGPAWLMLRDTTAGGQPTAWQFWTTSQAIGTPAEMADPAAVLADGPNHTVSPARELPASQRYTALGTCGVDVEYFIASPLDTPRHTLRYGGMWTVNKVQEYQDLLLLQLPGDGAYTVAVYPRPRAEAAPVFTSLAEGSVIKAVTPTGTDYAFLASAESTVKADDLAATGTAATVQLRPTGPILSLLAAGSVAWQTSSIAADGPVALHITPAGLVVTAPTGHAATKATFTHGGVTQTVDLPAGVDSLTLPVK